ncbi:recombinase family protein [Edaphosphingomonas haloaromaticamans]|uniref:Putative transposon Tn552 DNA-invertase bin3 n=1 Tax=Edaphosphingomonas haloaromaticamans TaxID=653954 RepID=A0A1S1HGS9_9SPHN|nr:recombinase family protein [Sphingomonas haloaromaticamans]OHT20691.1 putative transposon Tn552 DNA-invertase bin3 [Sphingomonas haloaromaticamans]
MIVGYARVSSSSQSLEVQHEQLEAAGCEKIFAEKRSGRTVEGRDALADALDFVREGDVLAVTRLDRLARSVVDLHRLIERLNAKGCGFRVLQQSGIDTTTSTGKLTLSILGAVAEFEADIRRDRQRDGIERAKARGVYRGRKPSIDTARIETLMAAGMAPAAIAREMGVGRASVYRHMGKAGAE